MQTSLILPSRCKNISTSFITVGLVDFAFEHSIYCFATHVALLILLRRVLAGGISSSSKRLDGQTIVVTGCNVGIGRETVRALSQRGKSEKDLVYPLRKEYVICIT